MAASVRLWPLLPVMFLMLIRRRVGSGAAGTFAVSTGLGLLIINPADAVNSIMDGAAWRTLTGRTSELEFHVTGQDSALNVVELDYYGTEAFQTSEPIFRLVIILDNFQTSWVVNTADEIGTFSDMDIALDENGITATGPIYLASSDDTETNFTLDVTC